MQWRLFLTIFEKKMLGDEVRNGRWETNRSFRDVVLPFGLLSF